MRCYTVWDQRQAELMLYKRYPKELVLTDGTEVTLVPLAEAHLEALRSFYEMVSEEERFTLREDPLDQELQLSWLKDQERLKAWHVVALREKRVVGHSFLVKGNYGMRRHIGIVAVILSFDFKGKGLGTWMLLDLIKRAMELELEKIVVEIVEGIDNGLVDALRRMDFQEMAILKDFCKDKAGNLRDLILMGKNLHAHWGDF